MAESSAPPPKSKPGSLRDRIAAFEKPAALTSNPKAPPVRPKPGHVAWKPAPPSPAENNEVEEKKKIIGGGMSASDAKESIRTGGGSLKERMAALQGMGAFGGGSPSPPPPTGPKPVKRPPLVVPAPAEDPEEMGIELQVDEEAEHRIESERVGAVSPESPEAINNDNAADDEDAKERQRREAIAARMARLGGARVGMVPPMLGPKPVVKPKPEAGYKEKSSQRDDSSTTSKPATADNSAGVRDASPPIAYSSESRQEGSHEDALNEKLEEPKVPSSPIATVVPYTSSPPQVTSTSSHSPPSSVPIPSAPRRAAPPRKKKVGPKKQDDNSSDTISPIPGESPEATLAAPVDVVEDKKEDHEIAETMILADKLEEKAVQEDKESSPDNSETAALGEIIHETVTYSVDNEHVQDASKGIDAISRSVGPVPEERAPLAYEPEPEVSTAKTAKAEGIDVEIYGDEVHGHEEDVKVPVDFSTVVEEAHSPPKAKSIDTEEEADDDEDEDRKTRLAEKIAKMGGLNPFAAASAFPPRPDIPPRMASQDDEHGKVVESSFATDDTAEKEDDAREIEEKDIIASPSSSPDPPESTHNAENHEPSTDFSKQESEYEDISAMQNEAEEDEDEATRKRRIAERIAKMGGRNPFSAVPAVPEPQSTPQHADFQDSETGSNNEDESHAQEVKDETADEDAPISAGVVDHEDEVEETHVSSEADAESIQLPSEGSVKEFEIEDLAFHSEPSFAEELSEASDTALPQQRDTLPEEEAGEMAPSRIFRPIPPVPPLAKLPDTGAPEKSPIRSPVERAARRSVPPPPVEEVLVAQHVDEPEEMLPDETTPINDVHDVPPPPPPRLPASHRRESTNISTSSTDSSSVPSPPSRRSVPPRPASDEKPPSPSQQSPVSRQTVSPPGRPPIPQMRPMSHQPTPPGRRSIPPPPRPQVTDVRTHSPTRTLPQPSEDKILRPVEIPSYFADPSFPPRVDTRPSFEENEVLPDSEPDPVDPSLSSPRSPLMRSPMFPPSQELMKDPQEDEGQTKRRTIAERMAKLGGIKFGAPPPPKRPVQPAHTASHDESTDDATIVPEVKEIYQEDEQREEEQSEEAERARRQTIAARLAGMGGMRFGMLPQISASSHPRVASDSSTKSEEPPPAPPQRPLPVVDHGSEEDKEFGSDDGVKVEGTESEMSMEEVHTEDVEEDVEEIPPPPPPREYSSPPVAAPPPPPRSGRSSIPTSVPERRQSTPQALSSNNDFVIVDDQAPPPPPPPRARPSHRLPSALSSKDAETPPWELPDIPSGSFSLSVGANFAMDSSITSEDSTAYPPPISSSPEPVRETPVHVAGLSAQSQVPPNSEELLRLANSIGKLVHKAAASLFDKSKKVIVGDGTSHGFVNAVLAQVPQASRSSFGYLVYAQTGNNVTRRLSNIMPGDVVELTDAKLKGHKGLQSYHQLAGTTEEPLVAIIGEFDTKKSKIKVFQANQHVGLQTVESVSYRLDDLKSGSIKIFRVASA